MSIYRDRRHAGRALAAALTKYCTARGLLVLALPRGGVPVGYEVSSALECPLDVYIVRKLGVPGHEEVAMGALGSGGVRVLDEDLVTALRISQEAVDAVVQRELAELKRREKRYRAHLPPLEVKGRTVIVVDDGLATGWTMRAALRGVRLLGPSRLVVGVPVGAPDSCGELAEDADDVVCATTPRPFRSVGDWYEDFRQTTDHEVRRLLQSAETTLPGAPGLA